MKILVISPLFPPQGSGAEISTMLECKELAENGIDVVIVTNNALSLKWDDLNKRIKIYRIPMSFNSFIYPKAKPFGESLYWILQDHSWDIIKKIALKENIDVLHIEHAFIGFRPLLNKRPVILTIRDYWPICIYRTLWRGDRICTTCSFKNMSVCRFFNYRYCGLSAISRGIYGNLFSPLIYALAKKMYKLFRKRLRFTDKLIAVSQFLKEKISQNYPELAEKIEAIYTPLPDVPVIKRSLNDDKVIYAYIGVLSPHKGVINLLHAFELAVKRDPRIKLILCGSGPLQNYVRHFINQKRLGSFIRFIGRVEYQQLRKIYEKVDVVIFPSLWPDPFPRTVLEALLSGKPVLVNPVGGVKEQVIDRLNGFYANCYNIRELAEKILEISSLSRYELEEMGLRAREITLKKFDRKKRLKKLISIYEETCSTKFPYD